MRSEDGAGEVLAALVAEGWEEVEVYHKRGRSRTLRHSAHHEMTSLDREEGWAVRAGDARRSFYYAEGGPPRADAEWPEADGRGLRLPSARPIPSWSAPSDLDIPLVGENEARGLFAAVDRALDNELSGARLIHGHLADGSSEARLISSREVTANVRQRTASLYLEATEPGGHRVSLEVAEREARRFHATALARRLADLLLIASRGTSPKRDRGESLLAPTVMARLLAALSRLWAGPQARAGISPLVDRSGRIASTELTLIDNGRLPGGLLEAPVDGEGQASREVVVVENGFYRQPVLAWWQATSQAAGVPSGCAWRPGWRDLPTPGNTHFYLVPDETTRPTDLVASVSRGYYFLDVAGPVRIEPDLQRFAAPVCGFALESGRATGPISGAWLTGSVSALLRGLTATARDLSFLPLNGRLIGSPSVLIKGLELRHQPP